MTRFLNFLAIFLLPAFSTMGQDISGSWTGPFKSNGPAGTFAMNFSNSADAFTGDVAVSFEGKSAKGTMRDAKLDSGRLSFASDLAGGETKFSGDLSAARIRGTFEVIENKARTVIGAFCLARSGALPCTDADIPSLPKLETATQRADDSFDTSVAKPAYPSKGPKVLFDEAHSNFHKSTTNFKPFADLIRNDGYSITPNSDPFTPERLKGFDLLVISNAQGKANDESAFTAEEIDAVAAWVERGGSLLLVADHTPFGGYAEKLANRFGVDMSKGYTDDPPNRDPVIKDLLFSRDNKLLRDHPITNGRSPAERVNRVVSFTGQSLSSDKGAAVLKLGDTAYDELPNSDKKVPAAGRAQAIAITFGKGKIFVSGEAAMLTAQLTPQGRKFGMNVAGIDNRQYALNVVHWLSGLLK